MHAQVDYCGSSVSRAPAPQYAGFAALRDALNGTGKAIYYSICPHAVCPTSGTGQPYHAASVYAPPAEWSAGQRHALANSLLVEYHLRDIILMNRTLDWLRFTYTILRTERSAQLCGEQVHQHLRSLVRRPHAGRRWRADAHTR
jgi:hypothetical protein